jgi:fluoride exporter
MPRVLLAVALGGMLGSLARHLVAVAMPSSPYGWPWPTFAVNLTGCVLIGVLMVVIVEAGGAHRLLRPFLGVGVLGGYTTFSTYTVETQRLAVDGRPLLAAAYLLATAVGALVAVQLGVALTRAVVRPRGGGPR